MGLAEVGRSEGDGRGTDMVRLAGRRYPVLGTGVFDGWVKAMPQLYGALLLYAILADISKDSRNATCLKWLTAGDTNRSDQRRSKAASQGVQGCRRVTR